MGEMPIDHSRVLWMKRFISSGYDRGAALPEIAGDEPAVVWANKDMQNQFSSCVLIDGHLYGIDGNTHSATSLKCMEFASGKVKWAHPWKGMGSLKLGRSVEWDGGTLIGHYFEMDETTPCSGTGTLAVQRMAFSSIRR